MFENRDWDTAERMVDDWQDGFERRAAQARDLASQLAGLSASARSADDLIEVTVGRSGELVGLRLDEAIRRQPVATTEREILATVATARTALAAKVAAAVADTVGAESESGRAILAAYRGSDD